MYPIDTTKLKRQIEDLKKDLDLLNEKADEVEREESARSNAFLGLMSDLRNLASELEFYQHPGQTLPVGGIKGWADKLRKMGDDRFDQYIVEREKDPKRMQVTLIDDHSVRITDNNGNYTTIIGGESSAMFIARLLCCDVTDKRYGEE